MSHTAKLSPDAERALQQIRLHPGQRGDEILKGVMGPMRVALALDDLRRAGRVKVRGKKKDPMWAKTYTVK